MVTKTVTVASYACCYSCVLLLPAWVCMLIRLPMFPSLGFASNVFFVLAEIVLFLCCWLLLCWVYFLKYQAKRLAGKNVAEMTCSLSSGT